MFAPWPLSIFVAIAVSACAVAQADRFELALRLRALEGQLAASADGPLRHQAMRELDAAVQAFFRFNLPAVATAVDRAALALAGRTAEPDEQLARSLQFDLPVRLVAAGSATVAGRLSPTYPAKVIYEPTTPLRLEVRRQGGEELLASAPLGELPQAVTLDAAGLPEGDHRLEWSIWAGAQPVLRRTTALSVAADLDARLLRLAEAASAARQTGATPPSIEANTLVWLHSLVTGMRGSPREETVLPGHRLLQEAEQLAIACNAAQTRYPAAGPGQYWLKVPLGKQTTTLRLQVPPLAAATTDRKPMPVPLVLALHGAGGSSKEQPPLTR